MEFDFRGFRTSVSLSGGYWWNPQPLNKSWIGSDWIYVLPFYSQRLADGVISWYCVSMFFDPVSGHWTYWSQHIHSGFLNLKLCLTLLKLLAGIPYNVPVYQPKSIFGAIDWRKQTAEGGEVVSSLYRWWREICVPAMWSTWMPTICYATYHRRYLWEWLSLPKGWHHTY